MSTTGTEDHAATTQVRGARPAAVAGVPAIVYLLADHLDAMLARGEDLLSVAWHPASAPRCDSTIGGCLDGQRAAVERVVVLELSLVSRLLKARDRAEELMRRDDRFRSMARLFLAGTLPLVDAVAELGDSRDTDFDAGDCVVAYLRSRGLVAADVARLDGYGEFAVGEGFRVARRVELGPLMDLAAAFLDALELHYEIYPEIDAEPPATADTQPRATTDAEPQATTDDVRPDSEG